MMMVLHMAKPRLTIRGLKIAYSSKDKTSNPIVGRFFHRDLNTRLIINNLNLTVHDSEILGLVGESGSGKSVTVKSIFGMINFFPGIIDGDDMKNPIILDNYWNCINQEMLGDDKLVIYQKKEIECLVE